MLESRIMKIIRIAHISGLKKQREDMKKAFLEEEDIELVCSQQSTGTSFSVLRKSDPDIIIIDPETPNNFFYELDSRFIKLRRRLPEVKIILRTGRKGHEFVKDAATYGVNIIDDALDLAKLKEGIKRVSNGEHLEMYRGREQDLEKYRKRGIEKE